MNIYSSPPTLSQLSHDYDPNSLTVDQAKAIIHHYLSPSQSTRQVDVYDALSEITAENILAPLSVPGADYSAMDGYAFHSRELTQSPMRLKVVGTALAGHPYEGIIQPGEAIRIMTGAIIPKGSDLVVMQEQIIQQDDWIEVQNTHSLALGQNIRKKGEDLMAGAVAIPKGTQITPAHMGLIASLGIKQIAVYSPLKVAFFSTGDELVTIGTALQEGQIYDSNRYSLKGLLSSLPVEIKDFGIVKDQPEALLNTFETASQWADVIISSGGVSVGDADFVKDLMAQLGEVVFWKIAMKPGRPLAYGKIKKCHFFGLPGNPVAVMVTFYQFVQHALLTLAGLAPNEKRLPKIRYPLAEKIKKSPGRMEFQRGIVFQDDNGEWLVKPTGNQSSGVLSSMTKANCFIVLPMESGSLHPGEWVEVELFHGILA